MRWMYIWKQNNASFCCESLHSFKEQMFWFYQTVVDKFASRGSGKLVFIFRNYLIAFTNLYYLSHWLKSSFVALLLFKYVSKRFPANSNALLKGILNQTRVYIFLFLNNLCAWHRSNFLRQYITCIYVAVSYILI